jgi:hypothetical protein
VLDDVATVVDGRCVLQDGLVLLVQVLLEDVEHPEELGVVVSEAMPVCKFAANRAGC